MQSHGKAICFRKIRFEKMTDDSETGVIMISTNGHKHTYFYAM